jgi:hypothetical protein
MASGLYLFCLTRLAGASPVAGRPVAGLGAVTLRSYREIVAVLCEVSLEALGGAGEETEPEAADRTLRRALGHEAVVEGVMGSAGVLPARLGTVFSGWESLERVLRAHYATILRFLDQAGACEEWAVKGFWDRDRANAALLAEQLASQAAGLAALPPGRRYLQEQRLRRGLENAVSQKMQEVRRQVTERLGGQAADCRRRELLRPQACGDREMFLNLAFWVPRENSPRFKACLDALKGLWPAGALVVEGTGPWPPYSFTPCLGGEAGA